jgi:hypothetical protein
LPRKASGTQPGVSTKGTSNQLSVVGSQGEFEVG